MRYVQALDQSVRQWAERNEPDQYRYSSPATWIGSALYAGEITRAERDALESYYGDSWWRTGD